MARRAAPVLGPASIYSVARSKQITIENPGRIIYANHGFTKRHVVEYYEGIAPYILPHLKDRPVTLKRYPEETTGPAFYEKDAPAFTPDWVRRFAVPRRGGSGDIHYIIISDRRTLTWAAGVGTIEIHPFLAKTPDIERPTSVVFDLDPGEGVNILPCARVALWLRDLLRQLDLQAFVKVSGSRGIQVYVPLNTVATYAATQPFARAVAEWLHREHPKEIVAEMTRAERKGKVFIDWSQNADYKTTVGVYSLRAKLHRPFASLPVTWEELEDAINAKNSSQLYWLAGAAIKRVHTIGDLFAPMLALTQTLPEAFAAEASPANARTKSKKLSAPSARSSEQGGRRRYSLTQREDGLELCLELHDQTDCWIIDKLPKTGSPATIIPAKAAGPYAPAAMDSGTVELVEGSKRKGWMHLFFSGSKLQGDWLLWQVASQWKLANKANTHDAPAMPV